ncbi:hypothetical protein TWF730_011131 [Orbilia blumenaviensis]|uniref:Uncharacterized protein n=1 Tax=Orbilia blumenaviensis TaxID=1796055 RepID=A0AAV9UJI2_9PEZI
MAAEEDYFGSDDDFNLDQLQEIENAALLASLTQKQKKPEQPQPQPQPQNQHQKQQQNKPPQPIRQQQPQPQRNPYQISSKAASASFSSNRYNATQSHAGPSRPYTNPAFQPPRPAPPPAPKNLSEEEKEVRAAYLARNQERQRLRQQQQDAYLAQQRQTEQQQQKQPAATAVPTQPAPTVVQQQAYIAEQRQTQLSQTYTHRQRQLQPRNSYRQPTPSYITQPTLPSTPGHQSRLQNAVKRPSGPVYPTARPNPPQPPAAPTSIARPEEYANYDQAKELWDAGAATEVVVQDARGGTAALEASALGTSAFGTSAWISSNDLTLGKTATTSHRVTNNDMVDYDAVAEAEVIRAGESVAMDVDEGKGISAHDLEELEKLRKAAQQLMLEKDELQKKLKQATVDVQTKTGENLLLRKKMEKAETEHRSEVDAIRSYAQQKSEKADEEMAKLKADVVKMQADLEFDRNDQKEMHRELKRYQEKDKQPPKNVRDTGLQTPRKNRITELCDGFDADEAGMLRSSPPIGIPGSRGRRTPSKSAKRKRKANESPMKHSQTLMLPILQSGGNSQRSLMMDAGPEPEEEDFDAMIDKMTLEDLGLGNDDRQQFLESILSFKPEEGEPTILEVLENYHFPSDAGTSLAALFMENVPQADVDATYGEFPAKICCILIALWNRCYTEKFFEPLSLLLDFLQHVIDSDFGEQLLPTILESFVDVLQKTVMLNSLERFKGHNDRVNPLIDVEKCLMLFETVALRVLVDEELNKHFWALVQPDFIAPFMTYNQPIPHIRIILNTLPSSVFSTSYGPISPDPLQQKDYERVALIHASFLLTTEPKPDPEAHPGRRRAEILSVRSAILTFYSCIASTTHGITSLVTNSNWQALSRIIVRLHHELEEVYEDRYGVQNSVKFINNGVSFIHRVLKLQTSNDDIERLLGSTAHNGNGYKHLVVFARVAFVKEGGYLSNLGILPETVDMAMEVLEGSVTMEQGDEIWGLFRGRSGGAGGDSMTESMLEGDRVLREEEMKR